MKVKKVVRGTTSRHVTKDAIWNLKEIKGLVDLGTFSLEPLPAGQRALDSRIVLKVKYRADGPFDKNKATSRD